MSDAGGQDAGLARARAREHEHRPVEAFHRLDLLGVQAIEIALVRGKLRIGARSDATGPRHGRRKIVVSFQRIGQGGSFTNL
jgi:hypothetical protein